MDSIDLKSIQDYRIQDKTILWIDFESFETLVESLLDGGLLLESQLIRLFEIILKGENITANDEAFLLWNNLDYIVEEINDGLGDRFLKDITKSRIRRYIKEYNLSQES
ncbi:MAG: hypothetical protein ACMG57_02255 [Candidatus Dojkabacteria bacterium]